MCEGRREAQAVGSKHRSVCWEETARLDENGNRLDVFEIADELGLKTKHVEDLKTAAITKVHQGSIEG